MITKVGQRLQEKKVIYSTNDDFLESLKTIDYDSFVLKNQNIGH